MIPAQLWRRETLGYVAGAGLLLQYSLLFIGLAVALAYPVFYDASPIDTSDIVTMLACGLICLLLLALVVRSITSGRSPRQISERRGRLWSPKP